MKYSPETGVGERFMSAISQPIPSDTHGPDASPLDAIFYGYKYDIPLPSAKDYPEIAAEYKGVTDPDLVDTFVRYRVLAPLGKGEKLPYGGVANVLTTVFPELHPWDYSRISTTVMYNRRVVQPLRDEKIKRLYFDEPTLLGLIAVVHYFLPRFSENLDPYGNFLGWPEVFDEAKCAVGGQPEIDEVLKWKIRGEPGQRPVFERRSSLNPQRVVQAPQMTPKAVSSETKRARNTDQLGKQVAKVTPIRGDVVQVESKPIAELQIAQLPKSLGDWNSEKLRAVLVQLAREVDYRKVLPESIANFIMRITHPGQEAWTLDQLERGVALSLQYISQFPEVDDLDALRLKILELQRQRTTT